MGRTLSLILFLFAAIAVLVGGARYVGHTRIRHVYAELPNAPGVREGQVVRFRGIEVGAVDSIGFVSAGVRLRLVIRRSDVPLRRGDRVRLEPAGIFGDRTVEIVPGPPDAPMLGNGGTLALADSTAAAEAEAGAGAVDGAVRALVRRLDGAQDTTRPRRRGAAP